MKLLEVEGARAPVPHSWRRHCYRCSVLLILWVMVIQPSVNRIAGYW